MSIIEYNVPQGSPEWHQARAGAITASMFGEVMKRLQRGPNKGDYSAAAHDYAFRLAIERISGDPLDDGEFENYAMRRGHELEPEARAAHEIKRGFTVDPVGFVKTEDGFFGASADGFIGKAGGAEYKCFMSPAKIRAITLDQNIEDSLPQCQGGMWLTGREWWDFCLYCPPLKFVGKDLQVFTVERDDNYIETMEQQLIEFNSLVERYRDRLMDGFL